MKTEPNDPVTDLDSMLKNTGLTKREYFAAMAMQGQVSHYGSANPDQVAKLSIEMADALIDALNK